MTEQDKTILVVGSLNMDLVATVERLPNKGETVFGKSFATFPGGKGANQAATAAKLGAKVVMVGCVGQDGFGRELLQGLTRLGVDTKYIRNVDSSTGTALIGVDEEATNTIIVIPGANQFCHIADTERALAEIGTPGILLLQHEVPTTTVERAIVVAKEAGWQIILNPAPAREVPDEILAQVDILTPNEMEAAALTGMAIESLADAEQAGRVLAAKGIPHVVITMGARGAVHVTANQVRHIAPIEVQAVDSTAAGDAYAGAIATALAEGRSIEEALDFASVVAGLSVIKQGAQPALPWRQEVDKYMEER